MLEKIFGRYRCQKSSRRSKKAEIRGERCGACMNKKEEILLGGRVGLDDADGSELALGLCGRRAAWGK